MAFDVKDLKQLQDAYDKAKKNNYDNEPLPEGVYRVKVEKIELGETGPNSKNPGMPMAKIQFRIVGKEHNNQCLFYNQVLFGYDKEGKLTAFGVKKLDDFLMSLEPTFDVSFSACKSKDPIGEYADLLLDVAEDIEKLEYDIELKYKGEFPEYKVIEIYE